MMGSTGLERAAAAVEARPQAATTAAVKERILKVRATVKVKMRGTPSIGSEQRRKTSVSR